MRAARLEQGGGTFDRLECGGDGFLRVETQFHAALGGCADIAQREGGAAGCEHHAGMQATLVHDRGLADGIEERLHAGERLGGAGDLVDEGHALPDFNRQVRNHRVNPGGTAFRQPVGEIGGGDAGGEGYEHLAAEFRQQLLQHALDQPWLDAQDDYVGAADGCRIVQRGLKAAGGIFLQRGGVLCRDGDAGVRQGAGQPEGRGAAHVAGADDCDVHSQKDLMLANIGKKRLRVNPFAHPRPIGLE